MTATIRRTGSHEARQDREREPRPPRFISMEALGFIDTPSEASTWTLDPQQSGAPQVHGRRHSDLFANWQPTEISHELTSRTFRWGLLALVGTVALAIAAAGFWVWQRPTSMAGASLSEVTTHAAGLESELVALQDLSQRLDDPGLDPSEVSARTASVDGIARDLFESSGRLPASAAETRSLAADAATSSIDASRTLGDAVAFRAAVIQALVAPDLETDPDLIELDEAVRGFGDWQRGFDEVRSALPTGTMPEVTAEMDVIAGDLESVRNSYVDSLRTDDRLAAEQALDDLADRLAYAEELLAAGLAQTGEEVSRLVQQSLTGIRLILG